MRGMAAVAIAGLVAGCTGMVNRYDAMSDCQKDYPIPQGALIRYWASYYSDRGAAQQLADHDRQIEACYRNKLAAMGAGGRAKGKGAEPGGVAGN